MYRNSLFSQGAKNITKYQLRTGNRPSPVSYNGRGMKCGSGIDDYLLSLIGSVGKMSIKPKTATRTTKRRTGSGLKFIR
jgi:hypothetical protein